MFKPKNKMLNWKHFVTFSFSTLVLLFCFNLINKERTRDKVRKAPGFQAKGCGFKPENWFCSGYDAQEHSYGDLMLLLGIEILKTYTNTHVGKHTRTHKSVTGMTCQSLLA